MKKEEHIRLLLNLAIEVFDKRLAESNPEYGKFEMINDVFNIINNTQEIQSPESGTPTESTISLTLPPVPEEITVTAYVSDPNDNVTIQEPTTATEVTPVVAAPTAPKPIDFIIEKPELDQTDLTPFDSGFITEDPEAPKPASKKLYDDNTQIIFDNRIYLYYGSLGKYTMVEDPDQLQKLDWSKEAKDLNHTLTPEELLNVAITDISSNEVFSQKDVRDTTLAELLEKGLSTYKFKMFLERAIKQYQISSAPKNELILTDHQQGVFDGVINKINEIMNMNTIGLHANAEVPAQRMVVFEGAAGTGKTTTMSKVLETLNDQGYSICFCSPTHQALAVIRETLIEANLLFTEDPDEFIQFQGSEGIIIRTLASFLGIKMKRNLETGEETFSTDKKAVTFKVDILAIDESSMVSKDQLLVILKRLNVDFKAILFIGDEPQLPSPSDKNEPNGVFGLPYKYSLTKVVRQAEGSKLLELAHMIRGMILSNNIYAKPSEVVNTSFSNQNDIFIYRNQEEFLDHYYNDPEDSKVISTYTNNITNEYNSYIRNLAITNQIPSTKLKIVTNKDSIDKIADKDAKPFITDWGDYKDYFPGEKIIISEANQKNNTVIHQNGEIITISKAIKQEHKVFIETPSEELNQPAIVNEYTLRYWRIIDTKDRTVNVLAPEDKELYNELTILLSNEANRRTGKTKWKKYWSFREQFTKVNYLYGATLYKLQGSTYQNMYVDLRDLDKFHQWNPMIVYKLLYVALTRPKNRAVILI